MKRLLQPKLVISAIVVIMVSITLFIIFIRPDPLTQPTHQLQRDNLQVGDAITISGHVAYNSYLACRETESAEACDGTHPQFINLQTADQLLTITYSAASNGCDNPGAASQGRQAMTRQPVEVFAEVSEQGALTTCHDATHYIQPPSRP